MLKSRAGFNRIFNCNVLNRAGQGASSSSMTTHPKYNMKLHLSVTYLIV